MIKHYTARISEVTAEETERMFTLLQSYYFGTSRDDFYKDFLEKECVFILKDERKKTIVGFSTVVCYTIQINGRKKRVIFSGDTVVLEQYRQSFGFAIEIGSYFRSIQDRFPQDEIYYLLTSKGWRTYRTLPFLFREFYPHPDKETPRKEKELISEFCTRKYSTLYDEKRGVITSDMNRQRLIPGTLDSVIRNNADKYTSLFLTQNPGFMRGEELICVAQVNRWNVGTGLRRFEKKIKSYSNSGRMDEYCENILC